MFWGLKGRTVKPRLAKARQRPATTRLLPTSEPVPMNIRLGVDLELNANLRFDILLAEWVLYLGHFGHQVSIFDQLFLGIAAC